MEEDTMQEERIGRGGGGRKEQLVNRVRRLSDDTNSNNSDNSSQKNNWATDDENEDHHQHQPFKYVSMCDLTATKSFNEKLDNNKMTGYLEKRSKMLGWKRFWFVLDGRLLTYFKSKTDYESLCAFSGSINLGIATHVSPIKASKGFPFQIVTRTQVYHLRVLEKPELERWLIAIQEAATIPPNISLPVFVDPGIQFYRYSFQSLSQWSLSASTEDLTSSKNLPINFYRPSSILKKCHSFASLTHNNNNKTNNNKSTTTTSKNNKSDSSNQNKKSNKAYQSTYTYGDSHQHHQDCREMQEIIPRNKNNHNNLHKMRHTSSLLVLDSSTQAGELRRELAQKLTPSVQPSSTVPPRGSSSSSSTNRGVKNNPPKADKKGDENEETDQPQMIFPKTLRSYNQQKHQTVIPVVYTNTTNTTITTANYQNQTDVNHEYDEIIDLDQGIYEPCGSPSMDDDDDDRQLQTKGGRGKKTESIYENVDNQTPIVPSEDPWERLPNFNTNNNNRNVKPPSNLRPGANPDVIPAGAASSTARNRRSLPHRESTGRNSLGSIAEIPEKESTTNSLSGSSSSDVSRASRPPPTMLGGHSTLPGPLMIGRRSTLPQSRDDWDRSSDKADAESSTSSDGKSKKKKRQIKKGSIGRFLQKIFTKSDGSKRRDHHESRDMVITGPVDLRRPPLEFSSQEYLSSSSSSSRRTSNILVADAAGQNNKRQSQQQQQEVQQQLLEKSKSVTGLKPAVGSNVISSDKLLEELNQKIGQMKRSNSDGQSFGFPSAAREQRRSMRKSMSHSGAIEEEGSGGSGGGGNNNVDESSQKQMSNRSSCTSSSSYSGSLSGGRSRSGSGSNSNPVPSSTAVTMEEDEEEEESQDGQNGGCVVSRRTSDSEEFLRKLARFNRLSASLNPSFVAALSNHNGNGGSKIGRSYSCRVRPSEEPPVLPPKRKQCPPISVYDVPKNNSPVILRPPVSLDAAVVAAAAGAHSEAIVTASTINGGGGRVPPPPRSSTLRELTKKSSAPDISFAGSCNSTSGSTSSESASLLRKSLMETSSQDQVFDDQQQSNGNGNGHSKSTTSRTVHNFGKSMKAPPPPPPPRPPKCQASHDHDELVQENEHDSSESTVDNIECDDDHETIQMNDNVLNPIVIDASSDSSDNINVKDDHNTILTVKDNDEAQDQIEEEQNSVKKMEENENSNEFKITDLVQENHSQQQDLVGNTKKEELLCENNSDTCTKMMEDENCTKIDDDESQSTILPSVDDDNTNVQDKDEIVKVKASCDSCIQSNEILEAPQTCLATLEIFEQSNKSTLKYVEAPVRHHAEILEIPDLLKIKLKNIVDEDDDNENVVRASSPTPSEGMELLSDISNSNSPPESPLERLDGQKSMATAIAESMKNKKTIKNINNEIIMSPKIISHAGQNWIQDNKITMTTSPCQSNTNIVDSVSDETQNMKKLKNHETVKKLVNQSLSEVNENVDDDEHHYDDVPFENVGPEEQKLTLNYASCHSVPWETVEETEEEEAYELYDDFPADDYIFSATAVSKTTPASSDIIQRVHDDGVVPSVSAESTFRHSGIDQLKAFLSSSTEMTDDVMSSTSLNFSSSNNQKIRGGAVSRLGHSSAVEQLKKIVGHNNNDG